MSTIGRFAVDLSVHAAVLSCATVVGAILFAVTIRRRSDRIALPIALLFALATVWSFADAMQIVLEDPAAMRFWFSVRAATAGPVAVLYLWVVLEHLDLRQHLTRARLAGLLGVSAVTAALLATGWYSDLYVRSIQFVRLTDPMFGTTYTVPDPVYGPWALVAFAYNVAVNLTSLALLLRSTSRARGTTAYRGQTLVLLFALVFPLATNVAFVLGVLAVDLTGATFVVALALLSAAIFRYELFRLVPIARDTAVENAAEGFLVLDRDDRIVDANPAVGGMLGRTPSALVDRPIASLREQAPGLVERILKAGDESGDASDPRHEGVIELRHEDELMFVDVVASPISDGGDDPAGRVVLLQDVTERVRREDSLEERTEELRARTRELERQNERLEEFASVLSHDLRNPLAVAQSYLEQARETGDPDDFETARDGLDRIDRMVDDLLAMARHGQTVLETEQLSLAAQTRAAWEHVDTGDAHVDVCDDAAIEGDETRLLQILENLFRNSIEHGATNANAADRADAVDAAGDPGLSVTVGTLEDGFYLEDDGSGIPPDVRDRVFERGFSTGEDGAGLGLSIVAAAVDAHGWSIEATESTTGGARFEIRGVEFAVADSA